MAAASSATHRLLVDAADLGKPMTNLIYGVRATPVTSLELAIKAMDAAMKEWCADNHASNVVLTKQSVKLAASYHEYADCENVLPCAAVRDSVAAIQVHLHALQAQMVQVAAQQLAVESAELEKAAREAQLGAKQQGRAQFSVENRAGGRDSAQPGAVVGARVAPSQVCSFGSCSNITSRPSSSTFM
jgi:hypothetical protein